MTQLSPRARVALLGAITSTLFVALTLSVPRGVVDGAAPNEVSASAAITGGIAPVTELRNSAQPLAVAPLGTDLFVLGRPSGANDLFVFRVDSAGTVLSQHRTGLTALGFRVGLAVAPDKTAWVGVGSRLARVAADGSISNFTLPSPHHPLSLAQRGPAPSGSGTGPAENGQVTSLALSHGLLLIGRAGHMEITRLDAATGVFDSIALHGIGDVDQFTTGGDRVFFTVNHSASNPSAVSDKFGIYEATTQTVSAVAVRARSLANSGARIAIAGVDGIRMIEGAPTSVPRALSPQGRYDESRIAVRSDGVSIVRRAGALNEVAFVDSRGQEIGRQQYQVPMVMSPVGKRVPYASSFVFASATEDGAVWFGLYGSAALYRLPNV